MTIRTDGSSDARKAVKAVCPQCGRKYRLDERYAGRELKCRACGVAVPVPWSVEAVLRPKEQEPGPVRRFLRRIARIAAGTGKSRFSKQKWLPEDRVRTLRLGAAATLLVSLIAGGYSYLTSESAQLTFGTQEGKEVALRRLVRLEEDLGEALAGVRSPGDAEPAANRIRAITEEQLDLWETLAEWKQEDALTTGELSLLRSRYREPFEKASARVTAERLRVAKLPQAGRTALRGFQPHGSEITIARRQVLGGPSL